jgi:hypothetical protein
MWVMTRVETVGYYRSSYGLGVGEDDSSRRRLPGVEMPVFQMVLTLALTCFLSPGERTSF